MKNPILAVVLLAGIGACAGGQLMTDPVEEATLQAQDAQIEEAQKGVEEAAAVVASGDATPEDVARLQAAYDTLQAKVEEQREFIAAKTQERVGMISSLVGLIPGVPPAPPWLDALILPLIGLAAPRSRQHLVAGLKSGTRGEIGAMLGSASKMVGWTHSSSDPNVLLDVARRKALRVEDLRLADKIAKVESGSVA